MQVAEIYKNKYKYFAVGALGTFMATFDGSIVNVALPTIADSFNASVDLVAWVVLSYSLTLISLMLLFGAWIQKRGYKFGYWFGYIFFLIGSTACAFSVSIYMLIAARVIQAIGTAMFAAIGPGMVTTVFPENERGKGIGLTVMMVSAGFMTGPTLGGLMLSIWTWHSIFLINIPFGLIGIVLVYRYFKNFPYEKIEQAGKYLTAIVISIFLVSFVFALKLLSKYSYSDYRIILLLLISIFALIFYFRLEAKKQYALIGLDIFKNRQFTTALFTQLMHFTAVSGVFILVPFYLERICGYEPMNVGLFLVVIPILMFLFSPLSGTLSDKIGFKIPTTIGMIMMASGLYLLTFFDAQTSWQEIVLSLIVLGAGIGFFSSPNSSALMGSVPDTIRAVVSSILATNRNIGHSVGVALSTAVFAYFQSIAPMNLNEEELFLTGFHPVLYIAIGLASVGVVLCVFRADNKGKNSANKRVDTDR